MITPNRRGLSSESPANDGAASVALFMEKFWPGQDSGWGSGSIPEAPLSFLDFPADGTEDL